MELVTIDHMQYLYECGKLLREQGVSKGDADHQLDQWDILFMVPFSESEKASFWNGFNGVSQ